MYEEQKEQKLITITQAQLNRVIARHEQFRGGRSGGARANLAHHDLSRLSLRDHDLSHADFTGALLFEADLTQCKLDYSQFFAADCRNANFSGASLIRADLRGACLRGAKMTNADLTDSDMREGSFAHYDPEKGLSFASDNPEWEEGTGSVDMRGATLSSAKLSGAVAVNSNFEDANLSKAVFIRGDLSGANLKGANLVDADLSTCTLKDVNLRGANLVGTKMDVTGLVNVDMTGALTEKPMGKTLKDLAWPIEKLVVMHKAWLDSKGERGSRLNLKGYDLRNLPPLPRSDLTMLMADDTVWYEFDFSHLNIQASHFANSDLRNCVFDFADLRGSHFANANMIGAKLRHIRLEPLMIDKTRALKSNFSGAALRYSDFTGANLRDANFSGADLSFADFTGAYIRRADFRGANLEKAKINLKDVDP